MALRAMDRYRRQLEYSIRTNVPVEPPGGEVDTKTQQSNGATQAEGREAAIAAIIDGLNAVINAKIEHFLQQRENAVKAYENAIVFAGEVAGEAPAPADEASAP